MSKERKDKSNVSILNNAHLTFSEAHDKLPNIIRDFLSRYMHPDTSLSRMNSTGIELFTNLIIGYDEEEEEDRL